MIETGLPVAERRAAQHCAQLLSRAADPVDPAQEAARLAQRFAQVAAPALGELCDLRGLRVEVAGVKLVEAAEILSGISVHSLNAFLALGSERTGALLSVATCEINAQFERLLGGDGRVDRTSVRLPHSAQPFLARFEQRVLGSLRDATGREEFSLAASQGRAADLAPFGKEEQVWSLEFSVIPPAGTQWSLTLVLCRTSLAQLLESRAASPATGRAIGERGIDRSTIGQVELPMCAILVDTAVPLSRLTQLRPGSVIPVAINRSIPLLVEHAVVAHGTAGEIDDRVALQITHTSLPGNH